MAYDIVKRIQQMVAKAESTDSVAEAESIMIKVREMLDKHGISLLTIKNTAVHYDPVGTSRNVDGFWAADNWVRKLSAAAAAYYDVKVVWTKIGNRTEIAVVGRESCRAAFTAMLPYLRGQVRRLGDSGWRYRAYRTQSVACTQIGLALAYRLYALAAAKQAERENGVVGTKKTDGLNMLVPVDEIEIELRDAFPNAQDAKERKWARPSAQAIADAATVNVGEQLKRQGAPEYLTRDMK